MRKRMSHVLWTLISLVLITGNAQILPYNPTTILLSRKSSRIQDVAYIFLEASNSDIRPEFLYLNISSTISTSNLTLESFSPNLPFLTNDTAYVPSISPSGIISVYTGSCSTSADTEIWIFTPTNGSAGNGSWVQGVTDLTVDATSADLPGAEFLASGFSFSSTADVDTPSTDIYIYGGMCPSASANASTWQSSASYSNYMMRLTPQSSSTTTYTLDTASSRGAPVAEAGFTITGLTPTSSNNSGIVNQQQNYVLLGGHTKTAFINMSQIAIWSLPEESWSFATVDSPSTSESTNAELTVKSTTTNIDSRSGHTAVLSEDGSSIIILGGWVGDINQAADPQLAILELGADFGGTGDWQWSVPENQPSGNGIYGHGAAMLPGNVMMVLGGFNITTAANTKRSMELSTAAMFFNATSSTWTSEYTNPTYAATANRIGTSSSSKSRAIGLGVGLGLGLVALISIVAVGIWYFLRSRKRHSNRDEAHEKDPKSFSFGMAARPMPQNDPQSRRGAMLWSNDEWNDNYNDQHEPFADSRTTLAGYESLHAGEYGSGEIGNPGFKARQIPRKPVRGARGLYQPTPTFDPGPAVGHVRSNSLGTAGVIHPIYEADEDAIGVGVALPLGETSPSSAPLVPHFSKRQSDPFKDPISVIPYNYSTPLNRDNRSVTEPSPIESPAQERKREIETWVADWAAADALLNAQAKPHASVGGLSPTRRAQLIAATGPSSVAGDLSDDSGRTASNLSDRSIAPSGATISRSGSSSQETRSNSLLGYINHAINSITTGAPLTSIPDHLTITQQGHPPGSSGGETTSTFNTAHSSFPVLQAEGATLLPRPDNLLDRSPYSYARSPPQSPTRSHSEYVGSPSKSKPNGLSRRGFLGSLRRVFSSASDEYDEPVGEREPMPTTPIEFASPPRRSVSASATLWRRKQGREDWEDSARQVGIQPIRSNTITGERPMKQGERKSLVSGIDEEDEDWDIERAVEDRVVQVMFTVPRERLRVVNHDVQEDISDIGSMGGRSRTASATGTLSRTGSEALSKKESSSLSRIGSIESGSSGTSGKSGIGNGKGKGKRKGKVSELVEMMEGRNSPERGS